MLRNPQWATVSKTHLLLVLLELFIEEIVLFGVDAIVSIGKCAQKK